MSTVLEARALLRTFGSFTAVDRVSFDVKAGEIFGYLGANGAGKSTTIRMLCGLLAPSAGEARVAGFDVERETEKVKDAIGYMSQRFSLYLDLSARANLEFFAGAYGMSPVRMRRRVALLAERLGLEGLLDEPTGALPGGLRQRVALASALLHEPRIVFLDEPTAGVGPAARRDFWALIREIAAAGTAAFVTTHYMDEAEYCDRVGIMVAGRLVALDTPSALKRAFVPGELVFVRPTTGALRGLEAIRALSGVASAEVFGRGVQVQLAPGLVLDAPLATELRRAVSMPVTFEPVEATLEDVFVATVEGGPLGARDTGGAP